MSPPWRRLLTDAADEDGGGSEDETYPEISPAPVLAADDHAGAPADEGSMTASYLGESMTTGGGAEESTEITLCEKIKDKIIILMEKLPS